MASVADSDPFIEQDDSEDDFDWEEVQVPPHEEQEEHLEITIPVAGSRSKKAATPSKFKGIPHAERLKRIDCHKLHTVVLLANAWVRNQWINDPLLHARLLSLTPLPLQTAFGMIHKSRIPDQNQRGRVFETAISNLVEWWSSTYFEVTISGHIKNRTYEDVQAKLAKLGPPTDADGLLDIEDVEDVLGDEPETIRGPKSLMKHALMASGSRDVSAQLFTALCRALDIPARLVASLQSVPWQTNVEKPKPTYTRKPKDAKGKGKATENEEGAEDGDNKEMSTPATMSRSGSEDPRQFGSFIGEGRRLDGTPVPKSDKAKGKEKAQPVITLRKTKSKGRVLGSDSGPSSARPKKLASPDPRMTPPVFWTEVFSRPDGRWIPVDPIRSLVNKRKVFDPTPTAASTPTTRSPLFPQAYAAALDRRTVLTNNMTRSVRQENRMVYVLAFEEDGYARDVTRRYAKEFNTKIAKVQGGSSTIGGGGKARLAWWQGVLGIVTRPYRLHRDDVEDEELDAAQMTEGMPSTIGGFKDHPVFALVRHLKQNQVIHPPPPVTPELGKFRGEAVYPRSSVVSLKTAENWMRSEGRMVTEGNQPLKMVKIRAGTINRMRELEVRKDELREAGDPGGSAGETMQGLYARSQTEPYKPDPVIDNGDSYSWLTPLWASYSQGKVPKNTFGNIDLYVPSMLPHGAVHVPYKGVAKIARKLGIDFAEAVTGFEFKKRRAFPVIEGVVIAQENETALLEAYWEAEQDAEEKARIKREERVLKQWTRLIQGLRIRQRLQAQYATKNDTEISQVRNDPNNAVDSHSGSSKDIVVTMSHPGVGAGGGFLVEADDVVLPFHLPKSRFQPNIDNLDAAESSISRTGADQNEMMTEKPMENVPAPIGRTYGLTMDLDSDLDVELEEVSNTQLQPLGNGGYAPKTMRELAEDAARQSLDTPSGIHGDGVKTMNIDSIRSSTDNNGAAEARRTPRSLRLNLKLPSDPATKSGASTYARRSQKSKSKKRARDDSTDDGSDDELSEPTPKKRANPKIGQIVHVSTSTRTLRPRAPKTAAQQEAQEQEAAYRRAIGR